MPGATYKWVLRHRGLQAVLYACRRDSFTRPLGAPQLPAGKLSPSRLPGETTGALRPPFGSYRPLQGLTPNAKVCGSVVHLLKELVGATNRCSQQVKSPHPTGKEKAGKEDHRSHGVSAFSTRVLERLGAALRP